MEVSCIRIDKLLLCMHVGTYPQASKRGYTYPNYAWILPDWYVDNWWTAAVDGGNISCTDQELEIFLEKTLVLQRYLSPESNTVYTDTGIVSVSYVDSTAFKNV